MANAGVARNGTAKKCATRPSIHQRLTTILPLKRNANDQTIDARYCQEWHTNQFTPPGACNDILSSRIRIQQIVKDELASVREEFGTPRRTEIAAAAVEPIPESHTRLVGDVSDFGTA